MGASLLIGPVDRRTDLSREMERANTHNELAGYRDGAVRVKMPERNRGTLLFRSHRTRYLSLTTRVSSQTGSGASYTRPSEPKTT